MKVKHLLDLLGVDADAVNFPEDEFDVTIVTPKFTLPVASIRVNKKDKTLEISP